MKLMAMHTHVPTLVDRLVILCVHEAHVLTNMLLYLVVLPAMAVQLCLMDDPVVQWTLQGLATNLTFGTGDKTVLVKY